jgi:hypothetical protein
VKEIKGQGQEDVMKRVFVDWSHEDEKLAVMLNGKLRKSIPKDLGEGDEIWTENMPLRLASPFLKKGVKIYRCHTHEAAKLREEMKLPKTDEVDVELIQLLCEEYPERFKLWEGTPKSTILYKLFKQMQESRKRVGNQQWAFGEGSILDEILEDHEAMEKKIMKAVKQELKGYPIWTEYLQHIKGVAAGTAAGLIGIIDNVGIKHFNKCSSMRHYFGVYPKNGVAARRKKGDNITYNPKAKTLVLGIMAQNFIRSKSPYAEIYYKEKERQLAIVYTPGELKAKYNGYKKDDVRLSKGHAQARAYRKMMQVFLNHLWCVWRQMEGLSTRSPYPIEKLKHTGYIEPYFIPEQLKPFDPVFEPKEV